MLKKTLGRLLGKRRYTVPLNLEPLPITDTSIPSLLSFSLLGGDGRFLNPLVKAGEEVEAGRPLAADGKGQFLPSPVTGKVASVGSAPDLRGRRAGQAIRVEPAENTSPRAFTPMSVETDNNALVMDRIREAGVMTSALRPVPLREALWPDSGVRVDTVVVLAADREPEVCAAHQLLRERMEDAGRAARLLSRLAGAERVLLAVPEPMAVEAGEACGQFRVPVLTVPGYPESLGPLVALRAGGGPGIRVVALETALAALDAVREGRVQDRKVVTVIGPGRKALGNYRVHIGTRLSDLLPRVGLEAKDGDKVVAGGPMRGFAQYSLDVGVDAGVDAVMVIPRASIVEWSDEPCVNSGGCVDVCPVNLQVQLIGRYAEFGLFDRAGELGVFNCIECGLCASVCTARRPLVQLIRLAKEELLRKRAGLERAAAEEAAEAPAGEDAGAVADEVVHADSGFGSSGRGTTEDKPPDSGGAAPAGV